MKAHDSKSAVRKVLVITGDPGGAHVLIPAIEHLQRKHPGWTCKFLIGHHSHHLWVGAGFNPVRWPSPILDRRSAKRILLSEKPDILVSATSFENPTSGWFRLEASELGIPAFSVIDHWCNYRKRFLIPGFGLVLPNVVGVMNDYARRQMIRAGIPSRRIRIVGHPVLEQFKKNGHGRKSHKKRILYLSEPISWNGRRDPKVVRYSTYNELIILKRLLSVFENCPALLNRELLIRPHPLEKEVRLREIVKRYAPIGLRVRIERSRSLEKELMEAEVVLGITSIAMLEAKLMGCPVLTMHVGCAVGRIPDDILGFLPRIRSSGCFIEAVSKFILSKRAVGRMYKKASLPRLPEDSAKRIVLEIEHLIHG